MNKFRICENCEYKNDDSLLECDKCGADLSFIDPVEIEEVKKVEETGEYRVCENCNHKNDVSLGECEECGANILFISPSVIEEDFLNESEKIDSYMVNRIKLVSVKDGFEIHIPYDKDVILGREGDISNEYFDKSNFISRKHARIVFRNNNYFIVDESTNGTFINKTTLEKGKEYVLSEEDQLKLADIEFIVMNASN